MKDRRKHGTATVEEHPKGSGRFRVRARIGGRLVSVVAGVDRRKAQSTADTYGELRAQEDLSHGITLTQFGGGFLDRREARGGRSMQQDRNRWKNDIDKDPIGRIALASLRRGDVVEWRDRMIARKLARQSVLNALNLVRVALADALDRELVASNVAREVTVPRQLRATSKEDLEGVLEPHEQMALLGAVPPAFRPMVAVALLTGIRYSELAWMRREDVEEAELVVRRSRGGGPTKSGKPRRVPLLGPARTALDVQLASLDGRCPWVFPGPDGKPRRWRPGSWAAWVKLAGIERRIRWHDLRHTCATSLLAGWWSEDGSRWSLDEVCAMLGHSSITVTERYARKLSATLKTAAARTQFPGGNGNRFKSPEALESPRIPKPSAGRSNRLGSAQQDQGLPDDAAGKLGTIGELSDHEKSPVEGGFRKLPPDVQARVSELLEEAYPHAFDGDRDALLKPLRKAAELVDGAVDSDAAEGGGR